uniref:Calpain catalytic domain-containing protein n=1 Tax=Trichuris muris TaxID=70415 RepID=A0A5S6Q1R5_TRIMR
MMVRLQNPWGEKEWNGAWSDGAAEWNQISKDQQRELGLKIEENGEFWMSWEDLCAYFTTIDVCYQYETSLFSLNNRYHEYIFHGVWQCGDAKDNWSDRSGGCANNKSTCLRNPQYRLDVLEDNSELIASLIQRGLGQRRRQKAAYLTISLMLLKVEDNRIYRLHKLSALVATSDYAPSESVLLYLKNLRRGCYVIIPSTFAPREEGEFMLRLYTSWNARPAELLLDAPTAVRALGPRSARHSTANSRCRGFACLKGCKTEMACGVNMKFPFLDVQLIRTNDLPKVTVYRKSTNSSRSQVNYAHRRLTSALTNAKPFTDQASSINFSVKQRGSIYWSGVACQLSCCFVRVVDVITTVRRCHVSGERLHIICFVLCLTILNGITESVLYIASIEHSNSTPFRSSQLKSQCT